MDTLNLTIGLSVMGAFAVCLFAAVGVTAVVYIVRRRRNNNADKDPLQDTRRPLLRRHDSDPILSYDTVTENIDHTVDIVEADVTKPTSEAKQMLQKWLDNHIISETSYVTFIKVDDSEKNIQYHDNLIKFATLPKLIEKLILETEPFMREQFFATYTAFTTPEELLSHLVGAYDYFSAKKQLKNRFVCMSHIKYWIENYFSQVQQVLTPLIQFIIRADGQDSEPVAIELCKLLNTTPTIKYPLLVIPIPSEPRDEEEAEAGQDDLEPSYPEEEDDGWKRGEFNILEWPPKEVARQLTLIEMELFRNIPTRELIAGRYSERNMKTQAPHLAASINFFNTFSHYLCSLILEYDQVEMRSAVVTYLIDVMEQLISMGNFNSLMAISSTMNNSAILRLKETMENINEESMEVLQMVEEVTSSSNKFANLRESYLAYDNCIPFIGIYLGELAQVEGINKNKTQDGVLMINWNRSKYCTSILRQIQQYQNSTYKFVQVPFLKESLLNAKSELSEDQLFDKSLEYEPK